MRRKKRMATMISNTSTSRIRTTMRVAVCALFAFLAIAFSACDPQVEANTINVNITVDIKKVSAGYIKVDFTTNKKAFYLTGIHPVRKEIGNIQNYAKQFMLLALDSAYVDYLYWRNQQLQDLIPFIADFASHSLNYGNTNQYFTLLQPNTEYWVYAFVVDPTSNKPSGSLFIETITTLETSSTPVFFEYRIEGKWDYVYPKDIEGNIDSHTPWVGETIDSITLREQNWRVPGEYFFDRFKNVYNRDYDRILYGIFAHKNDGSEDGVSNTLYEVGKTYYTAMAALDAPLIFPLPDSIYNVYRFTWMGDSTELYFTPADCTGGAW